MMRERHALQSLMSGAARVVEGIGEIAPYLVDALPVADDDLARLTVVQRIASIAMLKRFEQLQDQIGQIARLFLLLELEQVARMSWRDVANHMEKHGVVQDADEFIALRELRNNLVHEYPVGGVERADRVNECWAAIPRLTMIERAMRDLVMAHGHLA